MTMLKPGEHITAKCGRCNDITGHIITVALDGVILKVECRACGSIHKYRGGGSLPPAGKGAAGVRHVKAGQGREDAKELVRESRPSSSGTKPRSLSQEKGKSRSQAKLESAWQEAMLRHSGETPEPYSMHATFTIQTLVEHPVFGKGEVVSVIKPDKVEILFQDGLKTLRCKT